MVAKPRGGNIERGALKNPMIPTEKKSKNNYHPQHKGSGALGSEQFDGAAFKKKRRGFTASERKTGTGMTMAENWGY